MAGSAATEKMYRGELDPENGDSMPRSASEAYSATQSGNPPELDEDLDIEYDQDAMAEAIQAYESFETDGFYEKENDKTLLQNEDAVEAFQTLWSEN
jgi:hypothetical protein